MATSSSFIGRSPIKCNLLVLDCIKDKEKIAHLVNIANTQKNSFVDIFPWEKPCYKGDKLYIAIDGINICGWARVNFSKAPKNAGGQKLAYIIEISSAKSGKYKGIGTGIINKISEENIDFIKLTALQTAVAFYEKIGFYTDPDCHKMFRIVKKPPSVKYIKYLIESNKKYTESRIELKNSEVFKEIKSELDSKNREKFKRYINKDVFNKEIALSVYEESNNDIEQIKLLIA